MIHISKFGLRERIANVNDVAKVGEIIKVRVYSVDKEKGRIGLEKMTEMSTSSASGNSSVIPSEARDPETPVETVTPPTI